MKISNRHNLPPPLRTLLENDTYSRGDSRVSVTQLIDSPRMSVLKEVHAAELESDVVDRLWAMFGTALHKMIEAGAEVDGFVKEERIFSEVLDWRISGAIDVQHITGNDVVLWDWKTTNVFAVVNGKDSWQNQLNMLAELIEREKDLNVVGLRVGALIRDWRRTDMMRDQNYPRAPFEEIVIPLWPKAQRMIYLEDRVRRHQDAHRRHEWGERLPDCTDEEMWASEAVWAVHKKGSQRAHRLFATESAAKMCQEQNPGTVIVFRAGDRLRCRQYCEAAKFCDQFAAWSGGDGDVGRDRSDS